MAPSGAESNTWIGLILLPVTSNAPEHATAVVAAWNGNLDLSIDVAVGFALDRSLHAPLYIAFDLGAGEGRGELCAGADLDPGYRRSRDAPVASTREEQLV
jgi:hypothetical protein